MYAQVHVQETKDVETKRDAEAIMYYHELCKLSKERVQNAKSKRALNQQIALLQSLFRENEREEAIILQKIKETKRLMVRLAMLDEPFSKV